MVSMNIFFSGADQTGDVSETITVDVVSSPLSLYPLAFFSRTLFSTLRYVKAYATGTGTVTHSWDATEACDFDDRNVFHTVLCAFVESVVPIVRITRAIKTTLFPCAMVPNSFDASILRKLPKKTE